MFLYYVTEDKLSEAVLMRLFQVHNPDVQLISIRTRGGTWYINKNIKEWNRSFKEPLLILRDLDRHECSPSLLEHYFPHGRKKNITFRIAVRTIEAWLLADRVGFARFIGVSSKISKTTWSRSKILNNNSSV